MGKTLDLRTYLLLERAFARRLQRSWEKLSAPIYEKITQACIDHNWDKARLLVTDLDMTEVGTQNREWITYMLLSLAVFGAGTVAKDKPSFVGVGSFDTFLKQTTNNIIQYLEFTATAQVQAEALQSIAEDEAKTKALKREYVRDKQGRFAETGEEALPSTNTAIGLIHRGVVRVRDLKGRDPYDAEHRLLWQTDAFSTERFRYNHGRIEWLDKPNADDYFAVDDYFAKKKWLIKGHYGQVHGDLIPTPEPKVAWDESQHPRGKGGRFVDSAGVTHVGDFVELYHGTSRLRANKILKEGFKIRAVAKQTMGGDPESSRNYIWFAKRMESAKSYSEMHRHPAVLTVRLPRLLYEGLRRSSGPDSVWSREAIPAKYIHLGTTKWEEAKHPRDEEGQWTAGHKARLVEVFAKGKALDGDQILFEAEDYGGTRFILPDGTRLGSYSDSHWDSAQHLGVDMYDAMLAGVLRFSGGNGAEIGHTITKAQAQHLIDASVQSGGNQPLHMDVFMGKERDAKTFDPDRDTADTVRNWVNKHFKKAYVSILKFEEAKHPREPAGSGDVSGQFAETGRSGVPTPDPVLAEQAKKGVEAVEKLIPKAINEAKYERVTVIPNYWEDVDSGTQNAVYDRWRETAGDNVEVDRSYADERYREKLQQNNAQILEDAKVETLNVTEHRFRLLTPIVLRQGQTREEAEVPVRALDPETIDWGEGEDEDGQVQIDLEALRFKDGTPLTYEEKELVAKVWNRQYHYRFEEAFEQRYDDEDYNEKVQELESEAIDSYWSEMSDSDKLNLLRDYGTDIMGPVRPGEPDHWVTGVEKGTHGDDDYSRTHAIALKLSELRTDEIRKERGLLDPKEKPAFTVEERVPEKGEPDWNHLFVAKDATGRIIGSGYSEENARENGEAWAKKQSELISRVKTKDMIRNVWDAWKGSSSDGLSLSMQLAAAQELNGVHRLTPNEVIAAHQYAEEYGGLDNLKAYVRAQWEVTQMVMAKAKQDKIEVYRGLMLAGEQVNKTPHEYFFEGKRVVPENITVVETHPPSVKFTFNGKPYEISKMRKPESSLWTEVEEETRRQVEAEWKKDVEAVEAAGIPQEKAREIGESLLDKLPAHSKLQLLYDYRAAGRIPKMPFESTEEAVARLMNNEVVGSEGLTVKLPALSLLRSGAQSTTGTAQVANEWGGVGQRPEDAKRVVIRIAAPATSVLSLPVYGQNVQEEHESVLLGNKDKWLWDAWRVEAPEFVDEPLVIATARKADMKPLVIDLQAEDRGKPHWMSSVEWTNVLKWDESRHPRDKEGQFTEGVGHGEKAPQPDAGAGGGGGVAVSPPAAKAKGRPEAVPEVQAVADAYNAKHGMPPVQHGYAKLDEVRAGTIADAYEALPLDDSGNPEVRAAYKALATEIRQQFDHIVASGVTFIPWTKEGQPYQNSAEMVDDIRKNKRMFFYTGGEPNEFMAARDPETGLTVNDMFRAVHDYFGHAAGGYGFGPRGEENAWMSHSQMLTPQARRALTTETRGQNSWVNFGRHNYDADGNHKNIPPQDRPFATQKIALLPEWYALLPGESTLKWDESRHPRDEEGQFTRVAMTSQRPVGDPGHQPNKEVFQHMREFHERLQALPGVSRVSVKPGVGGWEGGSESMWQIYYRGNGEARKLVAQTAKAFNQDAVLILNKCEGKDCQPAVELSFHDAITPVTREHIHRTLVDNGIGGWTWMKREGKTILRMVSVPQWGGEAAKHQQATVAISQKLRVDGLNNTRRVRKVAVSVMEREGANSYDAIIGS